MSMSEFVSRFAAKEEKSPLFDILRRVGQLDRKALLATSVDGWAEWPPIDDPGGAGIGMARA